VKKLSEDLIKNVQKLIDSGKGDSKRLHEIFNVLKQGTPLYLSDYKYLENLTRAIEEQRQISESNKKDRSKNKKQNRKSETDKKSEKIQPKGDSAIKILKNRLATGEITIEEFQALKKVLKETH
jgi:hypothetical protein